ncbi:hypothetical protein QQP08_010302 [Theobroma cacao]|nr:hypothetical protein QQP08_010302 [Theobroma cacao]
MEDLIDSAFQATLGKILDYIHLHKYLWRTIEHAVYGPKVSVYKYGRLVNKLGDPIPILVLMDFTEKSKDIKI